MSADPIFEQLLDAGVGDRDVDDPALTSDADAYLAAAVDDDPEPQPSRPVEHPAAVVELQPFAPLDLDAFLSRKPQPPDWDWHGWYALGDVVLETGDPGVGKSLNGQARAVISARGGGEHLGDAVAARRTLYVDLESPEDVVYDRLRAFGLTGALETFRYLWRPAGFDLLDPAGADRLRATIVDHKAGTVWIDSLRRAAPGLDENDSRQVSLLFSRLRELAAELQCTIITVHHPRKPVGDAKIEALYAARGSGDLTGSVDSYIFYRRLAGGLVRVEHGKARRGREHEHVLYRIVDSDGAPLIEHVEQEDPEERERRTVDALEQWLIPYVNANPGQASTDVADAYVAANDNARGARATIRRAIKIGLERGEQNGEHPSLAKGPGRAPNGVYLYPASLLSSPLADDQTASTGEQDSNPSKAESLPCSPTPRRGGEPNGKHTPTGNDEDEIERLAAVAREALA